MAANLGQVEEPLDFDWDEDRKYREIYQPYSAALGYAVISWNRLQHNLGSLFGVLLGITDTSVARAIWYASTQDRTAREILRELAPIILHTRPHLLKKVDWLLDEAENLAGDRNASVHTPLIVRAMGAELFTVVPDHGTGSKKAMSLKDKELIPLFKSYADRATLLSLFSHRLTQHIWQPSHFQMPERPGEPHFPPRATQDEQSRKKAEKLQQRRQQVERSKAGKPRVKQKGGGK